MRGSIVHRWLASAAAIVLALLAPAAATAQDGFSGQYAIAGSANGGSYGGNAVVAVRGAAFDVSWTRDGAAPVQGFGLTRNRVLGVGYWPEGAPRDAELGVVIYHIDGGKLDGIWLPQGADKLQPGHEVLIGAPDLTGRFRIALGVNPNGRSNYTGYADFERDGDRFKITWHAPRQVFLGSGVKIGYVLVVAYAYEHFPAVAAYCANGQDLRGAWWSGEAGQGGTEILTPAPSDTPRFAGDLPSAANDPCVTPIAAAFQRPAPG